MHPKNSSLHSWLRTGSGRWIACGAGLLLLGVLAPPAAVGLFTPKFAYVLTGLAPGQYDITVFARSTVTDTFNQMQTVRVNVN